MERKFALFDIDKTLIRGDSLFALYFYGAKKWPVYWLWLPVIPFAGLLYARRILPVERVKRIFYAPLRRFSEGDFADFFDRYILARSLPQPMERLRAARREGFYILLVTASAACYMRPFVERGFADALLGTETERDGRGYTGRVLGPNCRGAEKVRRIRAFLEQNGLQIDYESSVGYSDSDSDIPMLRLVRNRYRVLRGGEIVPFPLPEQADG